MTNNGHDILDLSNDSKNVNVDLDVKVIRILVLIYLVFGIGYWLELNAFLVSLPLVFYLVPFAVIFMFVRSYRDFKSIVLNNTPLIDVRAPIEYQKGAFTNSVNLPLMNNEERHLIGIKYKDKVNADALKLGHKLVKEDVKDNRLNAWLTFKTQHPDALLYCFRGGQRSKISQEWMKESGKDIVRLKGGYKAFRSYLMQEIEESTKRFKPIIIGGRTGSGKTILLQNIKNAIDLEALANHRGSTFGRKTIPQPTQINFENALAYDLIQKLDRGFEKLFFEDEGKYVGSVYIPKEFAEYLSHAPIIILETPDDERINITFDEYFVQAQKSYKMFFEKDFLHE